MSKYYEARNTSTGPKARNTRLFFIGIVLLTGFAALVIWPVLPAEFPGNSFFNRYEPRLGLDLLGGTHLIYEADLASVPQSERLSALAGTRDVVERRVNAFGVSEPVVQTTQQEGHYRIIVELAGVTDVNEAIRQIGETPLLEFKELSSDSKAALSQTTATSTQISPTWANTGLSGKHLKRSQVTFEPQTNRPEVSLQFNGEGQSLFADITKRNIGTQVGIFLDGQLLSAPVVQTEITGGQAVITGNFTLEEAKILVRRLNAGALPVPIKLVSQQTVGAALGELSLNRSLEAGFIGLILVAAFMILYYRLPGFLAVLALGVYATVSLMLFEMIPVTLTLAGVAGFVLSIGMAVDANVLIFERLKEELRLGQTIRGAVESGFKRAWPSIRDSNVSSLMTCAILYWFGSSIIRGFALTLGLGILVSMFSAITVTRTFLRLIPSTKLENATWLLGVRKKHVQL